MTFHTYQDLDLLTGANVTEIQSWTIPRFATETARDTAITSPAAGQLAFTSDTLTFWVRVGAAWVSFFDSRAVRRFLGGTTRTTDTGTLTSETVFSTSGAIALPANSLIEVRGRLAGYATVAADRFDLRFRETNISGTVVRETTTDGVDATLVPITYTWNYLYKTTAAETKTWVATVSRLGGSGGIICQANSFVMVDYVGPSSLLTTSNP